MENTATTLVSDPVSYTHLVQPAIENIAEQIYEKQSLENIEYSNDNPYTSQIIVNAIREALERCV